MRSEPHGNAVEDFKQAMRRLTATVCLITTSDGRLPFGMAVTAVCSVGISPPSLLISVAHTASMHDPLMKSRKFGVNLLSHEHACLVEPFSGKIKGPARFELGNWTDGLGGVPILVDAQASLVCEVTQTFGYSGHTIAFGTVIETNLRHEITPLLYENGGLAQSAPLRKLARA